MEMSEEKKGLKETKEVLDLGFAIGKMIQEGLKDGKLGMEDLGLLMGLIPHVGPAFDNISEVPAELKDIDAEEAKELLEYAGLKIGGIFSEAELVAKINAALKLGLSIVELVKVL